MKINNNNILYPIVSFFTEQHVNLCYDKVVKNLRSFNNVKYAFCKNSVSQAERAY